LRFGQHSAAAHIADMADDEITEAARPRAVAVTVNKQPPAVRHSRALAWWLDVASRTVSGRVFEHFVTRASYPASRCAPIRSCCQCVGRGRLVTSKHERGGWAVR